MTEGRSRQQWEHTSLICSLLANGLLRGKDQPAFEPKNFNPYLRQAEKEEPDLKLSPKESMRLLGRMHGKNGKG